MRVLGSSYHLDSINLLQIFQAARDPTLEKDADLLHRLVIIQTSPDPFRIVDCSMESKTAWFGAERENPVTQNITPHWKGAQSEMDVDVMAADPMDCSTYGSFLELEAKLMPVRMHVDTALTHLAIAQERYTFQHTGFCVMLWSESDAYQGV